MKNVLVDNGALKQIASPKGNLVQYEVEISVNKFKEGLPALANILDTLRTLDQGEKTSVRKLLEMHADEPFGQGPSALSLFLAFAVRIFGDELRLQLQPGSVGYAPMNNPDLILALVDGQHPNAILERQEINPAAHELINFVFNHFTEEPGAEGQKHSINEAYTSIKNWWNHLPNIARSSEVYSDDSSARSLVDVMRNVEGINPYRLVLEKIQSVYGYPEDAVITETTATEIINGLKGDKQIVELLPQLIKDELIKKLMAPFNPQSDFYGDYQAALEDWYKSLGDDQKDEFASWHSHASQAVVRHLRMVINIEDTFFEKLPADSGFALGKVDDWHRDRTDEYFQILETALKRIESNRVKVPTPNWDVFWFCVEEG